MGAPWFHGVLHRLRSEGCSGIEQLGDHRLDTCGIGWFSKRNVVVQFALTVANDEVLTAKLGHLDVACECHDICGVCFVFLSVCQYDHRGVWLCVSWG